MEWLSTLFSGHSVAGAIMALSLVAAVGLAVGHIRVLGVSLGVGGVLFAGLAFGHAHLSVHPAVLEFMREFGLILFVFTIGIQVGPGFTASLRREGLRLNLLAAAVVLLGVLITVGVHAGAKVPIPAAVGLFSGATTNTPSLAAAQQAVKEVTARRLAAAGDPANLTRLQTEAAEAEKLPGLGYAVSYPFGILGIILAMLAIRALFRVDPQAELAEMAAREAARRPPLVSRTIEVTNPNLNGRTIAQIPAIGGLGVVVSRVFADGRHEVARPSTILRTGMLIHAVGRPESLEDFTIIVGRQSPEDLRAMPGPLVIRRILVTRNKVIGKTLADLNFLESRGVTVTRVTRAGFEFSPTRDFALHFGDTLLCVGEAEDLDAVAEELGNSSENLNRPQVLPIFVGIALGVLVGSIPFAFPGMPAPVKLGLAGGPLLVAILLSRLHHFGGMVWYMPTSANLVLREVGIAIFLACVGLAAGDRFLATLLEGPGLAWMGWAALITFVPIFVVGVAARKGLKTNYASLCGLLAGSMTDPPALAFAGGMLRSDLPHVSYATVYPLVMIMRVVAAQVLVLALL